MLSRALPVPKLAGPRPRPRTSIAFKVSHDSLVGGGCRERLDGALHTIVFAIALLRSNPVVVGPPWIETLQAHAECCMDGLGS